MNVFALDDDPQKAAAALYDDHIGRALLDVAHILSTTCHRTGQAAPPNVLRGVYLPVRTFFQNRFVIWASESWENFFWLCRYGQAVGREHHSRMCRGALKPLHMAMSVADHCLENINHLVLPRKDRTPFAVAVPPHCRRDTPVESYRTYYMTEKLHLASWTNREPPEWMSTRAVAQAWFSRPAPPNRPQRTVSEIIRAGRKRARKNKALKSLEMLRTV